MAAGGSTANVQLGPGRLYLAPIGTTEPASASAALPSAWIAVGYTEDGTTFTVSLTSEDIEVEEEIDPILTVNTKRANTLALQLAEITRRNLAVSLGNGLAANDATALEPPNPGAEVKVMAVWDSNEDPTTSQGSPAQGNRRWLFRQCNPTGDIAVNRQKAPNKALIPVTFKVEKPSGLAPFKVFPNSNGLV
jgi:hypothetical protein